MRLLQKQNMEDILFFDVETAHGDNNFSEDAFSYDAWAYDHTKNVEDVGDLVAEYFSRAPLYAEFGRIACITIGAVRNNEIMLKSFSDPDEKKLLEDFNASLSKFANNKTWLCGHNILDFDIPFVGKRCLANGVPLHLLFDTAHLKPWETSCLDTAILWKGTGWKKQSLASVMCAMGLPSPKDDISGKDVGRLYYEGEIDRIVKYCEKDVIAVVNLVKKLRYEEPILVAEKVEPKAVGILDHIFQGGDYTEEVENKLKTALSKMNKEDKERAITILNTLPTKAKGKATMITKKNIKDLV